MDETAADNTIRWYEDLEAQLIEVLRFIPPQEPNLSTWSPKLATIMVEACNLLESVLYHITPETVKVNGTSKDRNHLGLRDYAALYAGQLRLSERHVAVFQAPFHWRRPFGSWGDPSFLPPDWWKIHNRSKHRRLDHYPEFTLNSALDALAGAMAVIVSAPIVQAATPLLDAMIRHQWFGPSGRFLGALEWLYSGQEDQYPMAHSYCPETSLLAIPMVPGPLPEENLLVAVGHRLTGGERLAQWLRAPLKRASSGGP